MKKYVNNVFWLRLINSKIFVILMLFLVILISYSIYKEINDQRDIRDNIKKLEQEKISLNEENINLIELLKYYKSDEYIELQAREKLNMAREGERVVIVPSNENSLKQVNNIQEDMNNWKLWIKYFFAN